MPSEPKEYYQNLLVSFFNYKLTISKIIKYFNYKSYFRVLIWSEGVLNLVFYLFRHF